MIRSRSIFTIALSALAVAAASLTFDPPPAEAQAQTNVQCDGCVNSRDIKNKGIRRKDIRNNAVTGATVRDNSLTGADIQDATIGAADLAPGTALGLEGVAVVGAGHFHGQSGDSNNDWALSSNGFVSGSGDPLTGCIAAPVHLPDGVAITEVELTFIDGSASFFSVRLDRVSIADGSVTTLAEVDTNGINDFVIRTRSDTTISEPLVDAVDSFYVVRTFQCLADSSLRIYAVRIFYS